jgi:hypothetical protein
MTVTPKTMTKTISTVTFAITQMPETIHSVLRRLHQTGISPVSRRTTASICTFAPNGRPSYLESRPDREWLRQSVTISRVDRIVVPVVDQVQRRPENISRPQPKLLQKGFEVAHHGRALFGNIVRDQRAGLGILTDDAGGIAGCPVLDEMRERGAGLVQVRAEMESAHPQDASV